MLLSLCFASEQILDYVIQNIKFQGLLCILLFYLAYIAWLNKIVLFSFLNQTNNQTLTKWNVNVKSESEPICRSSVEPVHT